jgi:hypothetical protein
LFTGGRKMRMGLAGRGKCRVPRFVVHVCHPQASDPRHQTAYELAGLS